MTYHESVVERGEDVSNSEVLLTISDLRGEGNNLLNSFLNLGSL
jgi:hypothetical protein